MNVTLVNTLSHAPEAAAVGNETFFSGYYLPLGILAIAGVLERAGHIVSIVDPNIIAWETKQKEPEFLRPEVARRILMTEPKVVGFATMCDSYHHTLAIAACIKATSAVPVVLGGPQATAVARETLTNFPQIDFIIRGEAEGSICPLLDAIFGAGSLDGVPNLSYRNNGYGIVETANAPLVRDLADIPIPAFHHYAHLAGLIKFLPIEVGRGCPFQCDFCSTALFFKRTYRLKSAARILEEADALEHIFGKQNHFRFIHDMLTVNKQQVKLLCANLRDSSRNLKWSCSARIDCVSEELLDEMEAAGCRDIYFGIETGSQNLQKIIKKNLDLAKVFPIVGRVVELGMDATLSFICGFPSETKDDLDATLTMIMDATARFGSAVQIQLHLLSPYFGTELFEAHVDRLFYDGYLSDQVGQPISTADEVLVRQYPRLFSSFYSVPPTHYDRSFLFGIDAFVYTILRDFPLTALCLREITCGALRLFSEWQESALQGACIKNIARIGGSVDAIRRGLEVLVDRYRSQGSSTCLVLEAVFEYESRVLSLSEHSMEATAFADSESARMRVSGAAFLMRSCVDISLVREAFATGVGLDTLVSKNDHQIVTLIDDHGHIEFHAVSPFLARVVELSDGKRDFDDVLSILESDYNGFPREAVIGALEAARAIGRKTGFLL